MIPDSFFNSKRIAITGGTGFIGSHLVGQILLQKPAAIRVISSGSSQNRLQEHIDQLELTVYKTPEEYVEQIVSFRPDFLFILGGNSDPRLSLTNPRFDLECNLIYNFNLLEKLALKKMSTKLIFASSVAVYGDSINPLREDLSVTTPKSPYGINKLAMEGYVRFFVQQHSLSGFSVRFSATYGPGLKKQVVYDVIQKLLKDPKNIPILGDGSEIRDLCYVDDQVNGLMLLAEKAHYGGEVYNLGSGRGISVCDLAVKISHLMDLKPEIVFEKSRHENHHGQNWVLDIKKAGALGHQPTTPIDDGLRKTIEWVKSQ